MEIKIMKNTIIINGKESQLPFKRWFLDYLEEQTYEDVRIDSIEESYQFYTDFEVMQIADEYFTEMFYTLEKIEGEKIFVIDENDL